jgi:hypothetical protein
MFHELNAETETPNAACQSFFQSSALIACPVNVGVADGFPQLPPSLPTRLSVSSFITNDLSASQ